jgi:hypothetical protein
MTMTMLVPAAEPAQEASRGGVLRIIVALVGLIEVLRGLIDIPIVFFDIAPIAGFTPYGVMTVAVMVSHPILGFAALVLALTHRPRHAIAALALFLLGDWVVQNSTMFRDGLQLVGGDAFVTALMIGKVLVQPLVAAAAIAAARCNRYLALAAIAVIVPVMLDLIGFIVFAIAVSVHGF